MIIPDRICTVEKKLFVTVHTINAYIVAFPDNMWLPLLYQPQSYVFVFSNIYFSKYKHLVTKFKYVISEH